MSRPLLCRAVALCFMLSMSFAAVSAQARPEMAGQTVSDRFAAMDADQNGAVSREEFFAAQPQMKDAAFAAIDADQDGVITATEWENFAAGHGKEGSPGMGMMGKALEQGKTEVAPDRNNSAPAVPALIMPPRKSE